MAGGRKPAAALPGAAAVAGLRTDGRDLAEERRTVALLGRLFLYPDDGYRQALTAARRLLEGRCGQHLRAASDLAAFEEAVGDLPDDALCDLHTRTFDLTPLCVPYLSVHLFGQESFKRARLMTGLDDAYRRAGHDRGGELPDHLGLVLLWAGDFGDEEWDELVRLCLAGPLAAMAEPLQEAANPYRHLLSALRRVLGVSQVTVPVSEVPHWRRRKGAAARSGVDTHRGPEEAR